LTVFPIMKKMAPPMFGISGWFLEKRQ